MDGRLSAARLRREGSEAGRQRGRGRDRPLHLPPLSGTAFGAPAQRASRCRGHPQQARRHLHGGKPIARGALYLILQNRIYRGETVHKDQVYPGEHDPIVDEDLWQGVQATLETNRVDRDTGRGARQLSLFAGLIYDAQGEPMTPSHAAKRGVRYRYYVSKSLVTGNASATKSGQRIPAANIEALVTGRIRAWLADPVAILNAVQCCDPDAVAQKKLLDEAARLAARWHDLGAEDLRALLLAFVTRVQVHSDRIDVTLDQMGLALSFGR